MFYSIGPPPWCTNVNVSANDRFIGLDFKEKPPKEVQIEGNSFLSTA